MRRYRKNIDLKGKKTKDESPRNTLFIVFKEDDKPKKTAKRGWGRTLREKTGECHETQARGRVSRLKEASSILNGMGKKKICPMFIRFIHWRYMNDLINNFCK